MKHQELHMNRRQFLQGSAALAFMASMPFHAYAEEGPVIKTAKGNLRGLVLDGVHVGASPCLNPYSRGTASSMP